jgi:dolichyl-phosphate beta-glucosyltransferase
MTAEAAEKVFNAVRIRGWGFDVEMLALAKRFGYGIKEIPVLWVNDPNSRVGASAYLKVLMEVFKIRWWLLRNAYGFPKSK